MKVYFCCCQQQHKLYSNFLKCPKRLIVFLYLPVSKETAMTLCGFLFRLYRSAVTKLTVEGHHHESKVTGSKGCHFKFSPSTSSSF